MAEWEHTTIGALIERWGGSIKTGPFGTALKASEYTSEGVPVISVGEIGYGHFRIGDHTPRVGEAVTERLPEYLLEAGDIVFGRKGAVDRSAIVTSNEEGWFLGSDGIRLRLSGECRPRFVYYCLSSKMTREWLIQQSTGSTMASLNQGIIARLPVILPPRPEQQAIADVLTELDDKIELNRRMNETLETMAQAIFRDWFVDFGPVRRKLAGATDPVDIMGGLTADAARAAELAALFPSELGGGDVPTGWACSTVGAAFNLTMGQSPPGETYNDTGDGLPFFQGRTDFGFRFPERRKFCSQPTRVARPDDTLISVRAPVGDLNMAWEECCIGRGVAAARHKGGGKTYTYYAMRFLQPELEKFESEGTVFGAINKKQFEQLAVVEPGPHLVDAFEILAGALDDRLRVAVAENRTLAETRDYLLPRLMSGEVSVRAAIDMVEDAA